MIKNYVDNYIDKRMDAIEASLMEKIVNATSYLIGTILDIIVVLIMGYLIYCCYKIMMGDKKQIDYLFFGTIVYAIMKFVTHFV